MASEIPCRNGASNGDHDGRKPDRHGSSYPSGRVWLEDAIEYAHESIEHAALSGDDTVLADVRASLAQYGVPM
jgi:hypothetical protein